MTRVLISTILTWLLASPASLAEEPINDIQNYFPLPLSIGTSGQPTTQQFKDIQAAGFDVVVNLAMPDGKELVEEEKKEEQVIMVLVKNV